MDERLGLHIDQRQTQTLTPMQLQFVKMLEMNAPEIEDEVSRVVGENPAIEATDPDEVTVDTSTFDETSEQLQRADYRSSDDIPSYRLNASNRSADDDVYEPELSAGGPSLYSSLLSQLGQMTDITDRQFDIARYIIGNIDDNGYLTRTIGAMADDIAIATGMDVDDSEVRRVWEQVRTLEPAGVGAVDLRDTLLLQLQRRKPSPDVRLATEIIRDYFDLFSLKHYDRIASLTKSTLEQVNEAMVAIRSLNPKPGAQFSAAADDDRTRHITPDFLVENDGSGRLSLTLLNRLPRLQIEKSYAADTPVDVPSKETRASRAAEAANAFIRQKREEAATFIRVLEMRQSTLFRVMSAIMQWQREFFLTNDPLTLRPMILKDISAVTGDDMSVISRVTAGKYVATSQGVYPLKFFFNERRNDTDDATITVVTNRIRDIIESEDKTHPLTDAAITDILTSEGIDIARRTVAKYRERLGFPVGRLRRKIVL